MRLRRLEAEVVRDAILAVSGDLESHGRRSARADQGAARRHGDGRERPIWPTPADRYRRSIYLLTRRAYNLSLLTVFDQPLVATNCLNRGASALPLQSLFMINDAFLAEQAGPLRQAGRSGADAGRFAAAAVEPGVPDRPWPVVPTRRKPRRAPSCCVARRTAVSPTGMIRREAAHQALVQLCLTLLNTSEFLFAE